MLSHSENPGTVYGPAHPDVSRHGHLQSSRPLPQQTKRKVFTLGVHDGPAPASIALLDLCAFPGNTVASGSPIIIAPASVTDPAVEEDILDGNNSEANPRGSLISGSGDGKNKHLFVAEPMGPDLITKIPDVQVCMFIAVSRCRPTLTLLRSPSAPVTRQDVVLKLMLGLWCLQ